MIRIRAAIIRAQLTEAQTSEQRIVNAIAVHWKVMCAVKTHTKDSSVNQRAANLSISDYC